MTFFYDLNKRMAALAGKQNLAEGKTAKPDFLDIDGDGNKQEPMKKAAKEKNIDEADYSAKKASAGKDIGKPGKAFGTIAKDAAKRYGSKEAGERVAGAVLAKLRAKEDVNEADVEEGNEFSGALAKAKASGATEFEVDGKKYKVTTEGFKELDAYMAKKKKEAGTGKFDKKQISTGTVYTRKHEEEDEEDEEEVSDKPKKKGRKSVGAGKGKKLGAKSHGTSKLASKGSIAEGTIDDLKVAADILINLRKRSNNGETIDPKELVTQLSLVHDRLNRLAAGGVDTLRPATKPMAEDDSIPLVDKGEYDREGDMALNQLHQIEDAAEELHSILDADENLPEWVQSKITKAVDYIDTARDYMKAKKQQYTSRGEIAEPVAEKAVSQQQQKFMGMAHAMQKGEKIKGASPELKKVAKTMKKSDVEDFAATKHKDLPKKVKEADAEPKAKGGIQFGKGVYESINSRVEKMITEGMNVSVNMSTNEHGELTKNITVSAEGAEAESLAQLLNLAGMAPKESGCGCGQTPCGCSQVEEAYGDTDPTENKPDYPTDAETTGEDDELLRRWAGGLNKPKSTGQTTIPVIASQTDRQVSEQVKTDKLGMNLYAELKQFKAK